MKYNVYCLIIVIQQSITLSHWISIQVGQAMQEEIDF